MVGKKNYFTKLIVTKLELSKINITSIALVDGHIIK